MKVDLERVEVARGNDDFRLPIFEILIIILLVDSDGCEESKVWHG
jgi:hypothetical protein